MPNQTSTPIRWGVIGLGRLPTEIIAPILKASSRSELVACSGSTLDKSRAFAEQFGARRAYDNIEALAADPEVDAIFIATPNSLHHPMVLAAARAGKHVLCEKPFALTARDGREMQKACKDANVILRVGFQIRLEEILGRAREIVRSGVLGELRGVQLERTAQRHFKRAPWRKDVAQGGVVFDIMVHLLDLVEWVTDLRFGEVSAYSHPDRREGKSDETIAVLGSLGSGCHAFLRASLEIPFGENDLLIEGTQGTLRAAPLRFADEFVLHLKTDAGTVEERFRPTPIYQREIEAFEDEVLGQPGRLASAEDGVRSVEITAAILESIDSRRSIAV